MSGMFPKYKLTEKQIKGIACIVAHEQPGLAGMMAEASQIANRTDIKGDQYATPANIVKTVTSGWYAHGKARYAKGTTNEMAIKAVKLCIIEGLRVLPRYIDEHDCMSDVSTVKTGSKNVKGNKAVWEPHKTVIKNKMGSTYTFYSFPGGYRSGVDPFGYTNKKYREKWGDFCYTVAEAEKGVTLPEKLVNLLSMYHQYIKSYYKYFYNKYDGTITTFDKAKSLVDKKKQAGLTCVVPLRWALYEFGLKGKNGLSIISAPSGSFKTYYVGDMKEYLTRITKGGPIGKTIKQAIDGGLLKKGDIVCYEGITHTSVYSGSGYKFYEGGGQCVVNSHYPNGILLDYSKNPYKDKKISEVLRWKDQPKAKDGVIKDVKGTVKTPAKSKYTGVFPILPPRGYYRNGDGIDIYISYQPHIKNLQKLIKWITGKSIEVDGKYGKNTVAVVKEAQKKLGVTADGEFGKKTLAKAREYKR